MLFCPTPASSLDSPRESETLSCGKRCYCEVSGFGGNQMDRVLCYLTNCDCSMNSPSDTTRQDSPIRKVRFTSSQYSPSDTTFDDQGSALDCFTAPSSVRSVSLAEDILTKAKIRP